MWILFALIMMVVARKAVILKLKQHRLRALDTPSQVMVA